MIVGRFLVFLLLAILVLPADAARACRAVGPVESVSIQRTEIARLAKAGIGRAELFDAIKQVSETETSGCWGGATGNFDGQLVSVGALQWNYGQSSLPAKLRLYRTRMGSLFNAKVAALLPTYGQLIFSAGCLRDVITDDCKNGLLALMDGTKLSRPLATEFDNLFESDEMIQIQMDGFVALVESVQDDLQRLFPGAKPSSRMIQWAIDSKVQMRKPFPGQETIDRANRAWEKLGSDKERTTALLALVDWYAGSSYSVDQGGTLYDRRCNVKYWRRTISAGISNEQATLLNLSYLASRQTSGEEGYWQALTFQRHAKIILGVGSVGGNLLGIPEADDCTAKG
jgi:hypothetical protein